jgi:hypothetical protein
MFEIVTFCVIALAIGYWMALWMMGRRDDVLHGDFVQAEPQPETVPTTSSASRMAAQRLCNRCWPPSSRT